MLLIQEQKKCPYCKGGLSECKCICHTNEPHTSTLTHFEIEEEKRQEDYPFNQPIN